MRDIDPRSLSFLDFSTERLLNREVQTLTSHSLKRVNLHSKSTNRFS